MRLVPRLSAVAVFVALVSLTGCGAGTAATNLSGTLNLRGSVYGGQPPVTQAVVKLYSAGKLGNGSLATSMLTSSVASDANGFFTITGKYSCVDVEDQVYLVATGGNPGLAAGTVNNALVMMTALGRCGDLPTTPFVNINELTTVAAAWALAPFMTSADHVGASATNATGLKNAFLNSGLLVNPQTGTLATLAATQSVETGKLQALANALAVCVNSKGDAAGCSTLFTAATVGSSVPTDTLAAALNIVKNPGNNVGAVFLAQGPVPPFPSTLTAAPHDWTLSMRVSGGGLSGPTALAIDAVGNVWVADFPGAVSNFTPQGLPLSANGYTSSGMGEMFGLTIDPNDAVWVSNEEKPIHGTTKGSVMKLRGDSQTGPGTIVGTFSDAGLDYPQGLAADSNGNILIGNYANSSGSIYDNNGNVLKSGLGAGASFPVAVAADSTHGMWLANQGDLTVTHVGFDGTVLAHPSCCDGASGIAVDAPGNAWVANFYSSTVTEVGPTGTTVLDTGVAGGLDHPSSVAIDGVQDVWVLSYYGARFSHFAGNRVLPGPAAGTVLSSSDGMGVDAALNRPFSLAVDATGNVWVSDSSNDSVLLFFGLATPVKTPVAPIPVAP